MPNVKKLFISVSASLFFLAAPFIIFAKTPDKGVESCFQYYNYGKIKAQFSTKQPSYETGDEAEFHGTIVNDNTFPLVDVILYAHVRRINPKTSVENGHYLVDKVTLSQNLSFLPKETKSLTFKLPIKKNYPEGSYQIQYFIFSKQAFHYGGRSFLEEDNAGVTNFSVSSEKKADVYFDIDSLEVNNSHHNVREQIFEYPKGPINLKVGVVDNREEKSDIPVKIKIYSFEDTDGNKLISQTDSIYKSSDKSFSVSFNPPEPGAYVVLLEMNNPSQTMFKYRFASVGDTPSELRMNDVGVSDFPATSQSRAWVCFHSPTPRNSNETTVNLNILNSNQKVVDGVSLTNSFSGEVQAISIPLAKLSTPNDFWVEAIFIENGKSRSVRNHYQCSAFDFSVNSINIAYDESQPDRILIQAKNSCGQIVNKNVILDGLRIHQQGKIIMEEHNYDASSGYYLIKDIPPGTYTAEAKFGKMLPKTTFTVGKTSSNDFTNFVTGKQKNSITFPVIIIGIFLVTIIIIIILFNKMKK